MRCLTFIRVPSAFVIASASLLIVVDANSFLKASFSSGGFISEDETQTSLLAEVEGAFGSGATSKLEELEALLAPMFVALPKNEHGHLGQATVRYALHRLFVQRHGWLIKGLHDEGEHRNSSGTAGLLKEQVPAYLHNIFERRLSFLGFGLRELGLLAATIEHLVHNEVVNRLGKAYQIHGRRPGALMDESEVDDVLDTYMTSYIIGDDHGVDAGFDPENLTVESKNKMSEVFSAWGATQKLVRGVRRQITRVEQHAPGWLEFSAVVRVAEAVGERFGSFQDNECRQIKAALVANEEGRTGRVRLSDFWRPALDNPGSDWQFMESLSYLRQLGVLDETDPQTPRVMIANYISSPSNCMASTSYYAVCCINECEGLLGNLEKYIAGPEARPERIAAFVAKMSSSSVSAPRVLPKSLLSRLEEMANGQGGVVQLHGRLFAQWMHHAFPRECPFPHVSGTTKPVTPHELESTGEHSVVSEADIRDFISQAPNATKQLEDDSLPWSPAEELLVVRPIPQAQGVGATGALSYIRNTIALAAMASVIYNLMRTTLVVPLTANAGVPEKLVV